MHVWVFANVYACVCVRRHVFPPKLRFSMVDSGHGLMLLVRLRQSMYPLREGRMPVRPDVAGQAVG